MTSVKWRISSWSSDVCSSVLGVVVDRPHLLHVAGTVLHHALGGRVEPALDGRLDVPGGELLAAAEGHVIAQVEGVGLAVLRHAPSSEDRRVGKQGDRQCKTGWSKEP